MKVKKILKTRKHHGQAILEYIIITSLIGIICLSLVKQFGKDVLKEIEDVGVFGQVDVPLRKSVFRK